MKLNFFKLFLKINLSILSLVFTIFCFSQYKFEKAGPDGIGGIGWGTCLHNIVGYPSHLFFSNLYHSSDNGESWERLFPYLVTYWPEKVPMAQEIISDIENSSIIYMSVPFYDFPYGPFARSLDNGKTWEFIKEPFGEYERGMFIVQDCAGTLFFVSYKWEGYDAAIFKSIDKGATWQKIEIEKGQKFFKSYMLEIFFFWADPIIPNYLYAFYSSGSYPSGAAFLVSDDGGVNWKRRENGLEHRNNGLLAQKHCFSAMAQASVAPYTIFAFGNFGNKINGKTFAAYTKDRGKNWHIIEVERGIFYQANLIRFKLNSAKILWAYSGYKSVKGWTMHFCESKDLGRHWKVKGTILPSDGWENPDEYWKVTDDQYDMWITQEGRITIFRIPLGFLYSDDEGQTFKIKNFGFKEWPIFELYKSPDGVIYAGYLDFEGFLWYLDPQIGFWKHAPFSNSDFISPPQSGPQCQLQPINGDGVVGLQLPGSGCLLMKFEDGLSSILFEHDLETYQWLQSEKKFIAKTSPHPLFFPHGEFVEIDESGNLIRVLGAINTNENLIFNSLIVDPEDENHILAFAYDKDSIFCEYSGRGYWVGFFDAFKGKIFESFDGGFNWSEKPLSIGSPLRVRRDKCNPNVLMFSTIGLDEKGGVFVSEDFGKTWERRVDGLKGYETEKGTLYSVVISPVNDGVVYAAVNFNGGIYKSSDLGKTWTKISDNPVIFDEGFINNFVCLGEEINKPVTPAVLSITDILPLEDGKDSLLISTMSDGIYKAEKQE